MQPVPLLTATLLCLTTVQATAPWITLYDGEDQTGSSVTFSWSISDLGTWKDTARSFCMYGFWVMFTAKDFDSSELALRSVTQHCYNFGDWSMDQAVESVRQVGDPDDVHSQSLSLFTDTFYGGELTYLVDDTPSILNGGNFNSAAISGNQAWSIYSEENYGGDVTCLDVHDEYSPVYGWFDYASNMGDVGGNVKSARKGCPAVPRAPIKGQHGNTFDRIALSMPGKPHMA